MKCAAAITLVSIAFVLQAFAVLRPLFPAKPAPQFTGGAIIIGDDSIQYSVKRAPATAAR